MDNIIKQIKEGIPVFFLKGKFDFYTAKEIKEYLLREIQTANVSQMVIDLSDIDYIDSTGLGVLVAIRKKAKQKDQLRICGLQSGVADVFETTKVSELFYIDKNHQQALENLNAKATKQ